MRNRLSLLALGTTFLAACQEAGQPVAPNAESPATADFSRVATATGRIPGQYIVVFGAGVSDAGSEASRLAGRHGGTLLFVYRAALRGMALRLPDAAVAALQQEPTVAWVEPDQLAYAIGTESPATWGLDRVDQHALPLDNSYSYGPDGSGVSAYIIDTGILFGHTDFGGRASLGTDAVTVGGTGADCNGHGTHVSGTVGGATYGIAKNVHLYAVRVLDCGGSGSYSGVIAGIDWVTANRVLPAVANMSLGGSKSDALNTAVENSIAAGVVYAVAAGNGNFVGIPQDACNYSPASAASALTVGATTKTDAVASFSNYGTCVDILAPGVSITSDWYSSTTATNTISGTSMATPHVTGAAALYLAANPSSSPAQVASALTGNATLNAISGLSNGTPNKLLYTAFIGGGSPPPPSGPTASFSYRCSKLTCSFDASASTGASLSYSWSFGDNTTGAGVTVSHSFKARTSYTVRLTVTDGAQASAATSKTIKCGPRQCS